MTAAMVALTMAVINMTLWSIVLIAAIRDWQHFHDERAARGALLALVLVAAAVGGVVSALGYFINITTGGTSDTLAIAAGVARGAMIVGGFAYVASLNRHKPNGPRGRKDD